MPKVGRRLVVRGEDCVVEYAMRADGVTMPGFDMLERLRAGAQEDPTVDLPDEKQPHYYYRLLSELETLSNGGYPNHYNYLKGGVWELKADTFRLTFYDTDGNGGLVTAGFVSTPRWDHSNELSLPEEFGSGGIIRVGLGFTKTGQKTSQQDLELALEVQKEDLAHDRS